MGIFIISHECETSYPTGISENIILDTMLLLIRNKVLIKREEIRKHCYAYLLSLSDNVNGIVSLLRL